MKLAVLCALLALAAVAEGGKTESRSLLSSGPKYCKADTDCGMDEMCKARYPLYCTHKKDCTMVQTRFCKTFDTVQKCFTFKGACKVRDTKKICKKKHVCVGTKPIEKCTYDRVCNEKQKEVCKPDSKCLQHDAYGKCTDPGHCETKKYCDGYKTMKNCVHIKDICVKHDLVDTTDCWEIKTGCKEHENIEKCWDVKKGCKEFKMREKCTWVKDCYKGICAMKG